jgi:hypothetical protein
MGHLCCPHAGPPGQVTKVAPHYIQLASAERTREEESMEEASSTATSTFEFDPQGLLVSPDDTDNPDGHVVPHHDAGTKVSFAVLNVGTAPGQARVGIEVDDSFITEWVSEDVEPGSSASPPEVTGIGRYGSGEHVFLAYVNPGSGTNDNVENRVNIE